MKEATLKPVKCPVCKEEFEGTRCVKCLLEQIDKLTKEKDDLLGDLKKMVPKSVWTATLVIIDSMDHTLYNHVSKIKEDDLITLHHDFGRQLRNTFKLWDRELHVELYEEAESDEPDDLSMKIIKSVWQKIKIDTELASDEMS